MVFHTMYNISLTPNGPIIPLRGLLFSTNAPRGGVHFHRVLYAERGKVGLDSMYVLNERPLSVLYVAPIKEQVTLM